MTTEERHPYLRIANDCREANVAFPNELVKQFARVARKLNEDWGKPAAAEYLQDLIFPSRPGRRGFPPEVAEEILALKNLHEERYANLLQTVWDPYDMLYKDKSGKKEDPDPVTTEQKLNTPSIYRTRGHIPATPDAATATPSTPPETAAASAAQIAPQTPAASKHSAMISQLLPDSVRNSMTQLRNMRAQTGQIPTVAAPASEMEELLLDAERLLEEDHYNAASAILEQITTLFPDESPFAYLRLMEIYHLINRREDYDWVTQRICEQFDCDRLEWASERDLFNGNLERLAERFLIGMRRPDQTRG